MFCSQLNHITVIVLEFFFPVLNVPSLDWESINHSDPSLASWTEENKLKINFFLPLRTDNFPLASNQSQSSLSLAPFDTPFPPWHIPSSIQHVIEFFAFFFSSLLIFYFYSFFSTENSHLKSFYQKQNIFHYHFPTSQTSSFAQNACSVGFFRPSSAMDFAIFSFASSMNHFAHQY